MRRGTRISGEGALLLTVIISYSNIFIGTVNGLHLPVGWSHRRFRQFDRVICVSRSDERVGRRRDEAVQFVVVTRSVLLTLVKTSVLLA